jgi:hypothetical protein
MFFLRGIHDSRRNVALLSVTVGFLPFLPSSGIILVYKDYPCAAFRAGISVIMFKSAFIALH